MAQKPWGILLEPLVPLLLSKVHNSAGARGGLSTQSRVQGGFLLPRSIPWQHKRRSRLGESTAGLKIGSGLSKRDVFTLQYSTTEICSLGSTPLYVAFTCVSFEIHQLAAMSVHNLVSIIFKTQHFIAVLLKRIIGACFTLSLSNIYILTQLFALAQFMMGKVLPYYMLLLTDYFTVWTLHLITT